MSRDTLPGWIRYDAATDTLIIYGQRYAAAAFGQLGFGAIGKVFRVAKRDGSLTIETMAEAPTQQPRDYRRELWVDVCSRVAGATTCTNAAVAPTWANRALAEFDKAFPKEGA